MLQLVDPAVAAAASCRQMFAQNGGLVPVLVAAENVADNERHECNEDHVDHDLGQVDKRGEYHTGGPRFLVGRRHYHVVHKMVVVARMVVVQTQVFVVHAQDGPKLLVHGHLADDHRLGDDFVEIFGVGTPHVCQAVPVPAWP